MTNMVSLTQGWAAMADTIDTELASSRERFPSNEALVHVLTKKVGDLAKVLIDENRGEIAADGVVTNSDHTYKELVQIASTAIRLAQEGDPQFTYLPLDEISV